MSVIRQKREFFGQHECKVIYSRTSTWFERGRLPQADNPPVLG